MQMKLLLHVCCAPCLIYPLERLRGQEYGVTGFFYNPNLHPLEEYEARRQAVAAFGKAAQCEVLFPQYSPDEFFKAVPAMDPAPGRCKECWGLRLKETAKQAREKGFDSISTTLLVSPYQDQALLKQLGSDIAAGQGLRFYFEDFRPGFRKAHEIARAQGIYCQKYCGCAQSKIERERSKKP